MLHLSGESSAADTRYSAKPWTALVLCVLAMLTCVPPFAFQFATASYDNGSGLVTTVRVSLLSSSTYINGKLTTTTMVSDLPCSAQRLWCIAGLVCTSIAVACNSAALLLWSCFKLKGSSRACIYCAIIFLVLTIACMVVTFVRSLCGSPSLRDSGFSLSTSGFICTCIGIVFYVVAAAIVTRRRMIRRAALQQHSPTASTPLLVESGAAAVHSEIVSGLVVVQQVGDSYSSPSSSVRHAPPPPPPMKFELAAVSAVADFLQHVMDESCDVASIVVIPQSQNDLDGRRQRQQRPADFIRTVLQRGKRPEIGDAVVSLAAEIQAGDLHQASPLSTSCLWDGIAAATGHFFVHARPDKVWICVIIAATADGGQGSETAATVATILAGFAGHRPENQVVFLNVDGHTPPEQVQVIQSQSTAAVINVQHGPHMATTYGPEATLESALSVVASHIVLKPLASAVQIAEEARRVAHRGPRPVVDQLIRHTYMAVRAARGRAAERFANVQPHAQPSIDYLVVIDFSR